MYVFCTRCLGYVWATILDDNYCMCPKCGMLIDYIKDDDYEERED